MWWKRNHGAHSPVDGFVLLHSKRIKSHRNICILKYKASHVFLAKSETWNSSDIQTLGKLFI